MAVARPAAGREWLPLPEVAAMYGVTPSRARQLVKLGRIEAKRFGTYWKVSRRWLDAQHGAAGGLPAHDPFLAAFGGGPDAEAEELLRRIVREEVRAAVRAEIAALAAALAEALRPPEDELRPRRRF